MGEREKDKVSAEIRNKINQHNNTANFLSHTENISLLCNVFFKSQHLLCYQEFILPRLHHQGYNPVYTCFSSYSENLRNPNKSACINKTSAREINQNSEKENSSYNLQRALSLFVFSKNLINEDVIKNFHNFVYYNKRMNDEGN